MKVHKFSELKHKKDLTETWVPASFGKAQFYSAEGVITVDLIEMVKEGVQLDSDAPAKGV